MSRGGPDPRDQAERYDFITFRPHSPEVWYFLGSRLRGVQNGTTVRVIGTRRMVLARIAGVLPDDRVFPLEPFRDAPLDGSIFTSDGRRWLYLDDDDHTYLGDADQPEGGQPLDLGPFYLLGSESLRELEPVTTVAGISRGSSHCQASAGGETSGIRRSPYRGFGATDGTAC